MMNAMKKLLSLTAVVVLVACSPARAQQGSEPAARVGDQVITIKQLEDRWASQDPAQHADALQTLYDGRRAALDDIVAQMLIEQAAKAKGVTPQAFEDAEVGKRLKPVTDADVAAFYQANISQMQGRSLEQVSTVINRYLQERQRAEARDDLISELKKAGPKIQVLLDPPRTAIDVAPADPALGNANAPVTIVEYADFECPFCRRAVPTLDEIRQKYGDKVRLVWKDFPLTQIHPQAFKAAEAGRCAAEQGKFWAYHDTLFGNQQALQPDDLKKYATMSGLDGAKFGECLDSSKYSDQVRDAMAAASHVGVNSTPTLYVNGRRVEGAQPFEVFARIIDDELAKK
jgi:protein-disulfide isomerase